MFKKNEFNLSKTTCQAILDLKQRAAIIFHTFQDALPVASHELVKVHSLVLKFSILNLYCLIVPLLAELEISNIAFMS